MTLKPFILSALILLLGSLVWAQERDMKWLQEKYRQLDGNGDGKVDEKELGRPRLFRRIDSNGDGIITLEEARYFFKIPREDQTKNNPKIHRNISYRKGFPRRPNLTALDIYVPGKVSASAPVMVYVHGGGWQKGDKSRVGEKARFFTSKGFIFVSVNYRLRPRIQHPTNVQDVAFSLAWVHNKISKYKGDPHRIFLMGHSAGAHLAGLAATDHRRLKKAGKDLSIIKGVVLLDTNAYDIPKMMGRGGTPVYRTAFGDDPKVWKDASPYFHVGPGKNLPPFLLVHADRRYQKEMQAKNFAQALKKAGTKAQTLAAPNRTHGSLNRMLGKPGDPYTRAMWKFIQAILKDLKKTSPSK